MVKVKRQSEQAKLEQKKSEAVRKKDADIFKASLKPKKSAIDATAAGELDDDSDWDDVEEDFPGVKLSELLDGLTLDVGPGDDEDDDV